MEDVNLLGVEKHVKQDQWMWRAVIVRPIPSYRGENADVLREW